MSTAMKSAQNDETQLPNSRRVYVDGSQPGVHVPFREISQNQTRTFKGELEENPPVRVYDTSGPWGDPEQTCDVRSGLPARRREWIMSRGDVEEYQGRDITPIDDGYLTFAAADLARHKERGRLEDFPALKRTPSAPSWSCVTHCTTRVAASLRRR